MIKFIKEVFTLNKLQKQLAIEIDKFNARTDEENHVDIYIVRDSMNSYYNIKEVKAMIKELQNA